MAEEIPLEPTDMQASPASNGTGPTEPVVSEPQPSPSDSAEAMPDKEATAGEAVPEPIVEPPLENGSNGKEGVEMENTPTAQPVEPLESEPNPALVPESNQVPESVPEPSTAPIEPSPAPESVQLPPTPTEPTPEPVSAPSTGSGQASSPQAIPTPTPGPVSESQPQVSTPPVIQTSLARELLVKAREVIQFRKRKKLEKIMSLFLKQASITNDDVEKLLHVSDATATRYLDQLEREGRIKKENAGKYLSYSRM